MLQVHECGGTQVNSGNVAHSISGYGVIAQGSGQVKGDCAEFSGFKGYKTRIATVHIGGGIKKKINQVRDIVAIDSATGVMALGLDHGHVEVYDSIFYGSQDMPNRDCPNNNNCGACMNKRGLWIPTFGLHTTHVSKAPAKLHKMFAAGGAWGGSSLFRDLKFIGYDSNIQSCGAGQSAIATNYIHSNFHPKANFRNIEF